MLIKNTTDEQNKIKSVGRVIAGESHTENQIVNSDTALLCKLRMPVVDYTGLEIERSRSSL